MIKLVLLDSDEKYLNKITKHLLHNYSKKIELYTFTSAELMYNSVNLYNINILVANKNLIDLDEIIYTNLSKAYFSDSNDVNAIDGYPVVNKYQRFNDLYEQIESLYVETSGEVVKSIHFSNDTSLIVYTSFCGGTGTSTVAISEAISKAKSGKKVLYLNLEFFDTTSIYFEKKGNYSFSDIVFEVTKNDANMNNKLSKIFVQDISTNVYYCNPSQIILDKNELYDNKKIETLFSSLKELFFDYIIVDRNITFNEYEKIIFELSDELRFVIEGRDIVIHKFYSLINAFNLLDERNKTDICSKIGIIYNKMSANNNKTIQDQNIKILATLNKYKTNDDRVIIDEIVNKGILTNL